MKIIVIKTWINSYGVTYQPSNEVLDMFEDEAVFKGLKSGVLKQYGVQTATVIKNKFKTKEDK